MTSKLIQRNKSYCIQFQNNLQTNRMKVQFGCSNIRISTRVHWYKIKIKGTFYNTTFTRSYLVLTPFNFLDWDDKNDQDKHIKICVILPVGRKLQERYLQNH